MQGWAREFRSLVDRERLKEEDGVEYFLRTLRPKFLKGAQNVFLYRLFQYIRFRRGKLELLKWMPRYTIMLQRLRDAWMDLRDTTTVNSPYYAQEKAILQEAERIAAMTSDPRREPRALTDAECLSVIEQKKAKEHQDAFLSAYTRLPLPAV